MQTLSKPELKWCINTKNSNISPNLGSLKFLYNPEISYTSNGRWEDEVSNI